MQTSQKPARSMPLGNPADVPIGSVESRARARAMVETMPMTPEEIRNATPEERAARLKKIFIMAHQRIKAGYKPPKGTPEYEARKARLINLLQESAARLCRTETRQ